MPNLIPDGLQNWFVETVEIAADHNFGEAQHESSRSWRQQPTQRSAIIATLPEYP